MGWIYLLAAFAFPPVFILWRPRSVLSPRERRVRIAGSVVVVWMLMILWSLRGAERSADEYGPEGYGGGNVTSAVSTRPSATSRPVARDEVGPTDQPVEATPTLSYAGPSDSGPILLLGWVPGLVYTGLLLLARKGLEPTPVEVIEDPRWPRGPYGQ